MTHNYQWRYYSRVTGCHRWFHGKKPDGTTGIAVCDESGKYPDETDDGVLWLDKSQPIEILEPCDVMDDHSEWWVSVRIALLDNAGNRKWLGGTNLKEARELRRWFGMKFTGFDS